MKKQSRGLNRYNKLQEKKGKKKKKILYICMIHKKTNFEKKKKKKQTNKKQQHFIRVRTHIHENIRLLIYILKNEGSTYCAKRSLENFM